MNIFFNAIVSFAFLASIVFSSANAASAEQVKKIFFRLYKCTNKTYYDVSLEKAANLVEKLNPDDPTIVYFHGYDESVNSENVYTIANAFLKRSSHNVIAVDYRDIANQVYPLVAMDVAGVGKAVAEALNALVYIKLPAEKIHLIGHSVGAHVASHVGKNVNFTLERISGLDPAGPLFNFVLSSLSSSDAKFVDVIHTDIGLYGNIRITHAVDFFPNQGRRVQPGCPFFYIPFSAGDFCSHHRAWRLYAESVLNPNAFVATKCPSLPELLSLKGRTEISDVIPMGYATPSTARGRYCLRTNSQSPYGLGQQGLIQ